MGNKMVAVTYTDMQPGRRRKPRRYAELRQQMMSTPRYARVLYDFPNPEPGELLLKVNDIVQVTGQVNADWLKGKLGHKNGNFPAKFVEYIQLPKVEAKEKVFGAIETFASDVAGDLHFKKGDVIIGIQPVDDNWWHGQLDSRVGIFPVTLVKPLELSPKTPGPPKPPNPPKTTGGNRPTPPKQIQNTAVKPHGKPAVPKTKIGENNNDNSVKDCVVVARANTDMKAQISDELSFYKGDMITILRAEDEDFYVGECRGKTGTFPIYFVDILEPENFEAIRYKGNRRKSLTSYGKHASYKKSPSEEEAESFKSFDSSASYKQLSFVSNTSYQSYEQPMPVLVEPTPATFQTERLTSNDESIEAYGRSLYPFVGQNSDELTFLDNEIITLIQHVDEQWTLGQIDDRIGIFPTSFVEIVVDCPSEMSAAETEPQENPPQGGSVVETPVENSCTSKLRKTAIAIADFQTQDSGCIELLEGETVTVSEILDENWCLATNVGGNSGYVPTSYIQFLDTKLDFDADVGETSTDVEKVEEKRNSFCSVQSSTSSSKYSTASEGTVTMTETSEQNGTSKPDAGKKSPETSPTLRAKPRLSPKPQVRPKPPGKTFITSGQSVTKGLSLDDVIGRELYHAKRSSDPEAQASAAKDKNAPSLNELRGSKENEELERMWNATEQYSDPNSVGRQIQHTTGMSNLETTTKWRTEMLRNESETDPVDEADWAPPSYDSVVPKRAPPPRPAAPKTSTSSDDGVLKPRRPAPKPPVRRSLNVEENGVTSLTDIGDGEKSMVIHDLKSRIGEIERDLQHYKTAKLAMDAKLSSASDEERTEAQESLDFYSANIDGLATELASLNKSLHQLEPSAPSHVPEPAPNQPDPAVELANLRQKHREKREKIVEELLETEKSYLSDLELVMRTFLDDNAAKCPIVDMDTLFGNMEEVTQLSRDLVGALEQHIHGKDFEEQCVGQCFVDMKEGLTKAYSTYCRNHDDVLALLEKYDGNHEVEEYFQQGVEHMKQHTVCFDLGSMLIKPVQRILKYPLLLNELMKVTEDSHPDKVLVIKGINAMTDVAQAINEYKRRKDLVYKYRKENDASFSDKISKINLHSLRKKSTRVSTRLSTSLGLGSTTRDAEFDQLETKFRNIEKAVKLFLRDLGGYVEQLKESLLDIENCGVDIREFYMEKTALTDQVDRYQKSLSVIGIQHLDRFREVLNMKVVEPLSTLVTLFQGPNNVIKKRYDKLLDYDHLTSSIRKIRDPEQLRMATQNLELAKKTYEALNAQLLDELPRLCTLAISLFDECVRNFVHAQKIFYEKAKREFLEVVKLPMFQKVSETNVIEQFGIQHSRLVDKLADLSFAPKNFNPAREVAKENPKPERNKSLRRSKKPSGDKGDKESRRLSGIQANHELELSGQNDSQIHYLRAKYAPDKLYRVTSTHQARLSHELTIPANHVIAVVKQGDPMGGKDLWFVDNGVVKGFVPASILTPLLRNVDRSSPDSRPTSDARSSWYDALQGLDAIPAQNSTTQENGSTRNSSQFHRQNALENVQQPTRDPVADVSAGSAMIVPQNDQNQVHSQPPTAADPHDYHAQYQDSAQNSLMMQHKAQYRNLALEQSIRTTENPSSGDSATAGSFQYGRYENLDSGYKRQDSNDLLNEALDELLVDEGEVPPSYDESTGVQTEYFRALYDFAARNSNELTITGGEALLILQKHDRDGNAEWWLAEKNGTKGFVPANYVGPLT